MCTSYDRDQSLSNSTLSDLGNRDTPEQSVADINDDDIYHSRIDDEDTEDSDDDSADNTSIRCRHISNSSQNPPNKAVIRILNWNIERLMNKLREADLIDYISSFDIVGFTETFREYTTPLDCFTDFEQFFSPAVKLTSDKKLSGGVLMMVKKTIGKFVERIDFPEDNMVWLKADKELFKCEKDVILCAAYICHERSLSSGSCN